MVVKVKCITRICLLSVFCSVLFAPASYAVGVTPVTITNPMTTPAAQAAQSASIQTAIDNLVGGYGSTHQGDGALLFLATPFNGEFEAVGLSALGPESFPFNKTVYSVNATDLPFPDSPNTFDAKEFFKLPPIQQQAFYSLNAVSDNINNLFKAIINQDCDGKDCSINNTNLATSKNYDINSLLGPVSFSGNDKQAASRYIQYASLMLRPFEVPAPDILKSADLTGKKYMISLRSYIAGQSAGLSSLYEMYLARMPVTGLGTKAKLQVVEAGTQNVSSKADASPLEIEAYAATRRLNPYLKTDVKLKDGKPNSVNWKTAMETASPVTLQRETVYLLAEIRAEMFKSRLEAERLRALIALMQIANSRQAMVVEEANSKISFSNTTAPTN